MSHSAEYKKNLTAIAEVLERYSNVLERLANVTKDEDMKIVYETLRTLNYFLGRSYLVSINVLQEINVLFNAIEKLPRKSEYEEIKNLVENKERTL